VGPNEKIKRGQIKLTEAPAIRAETLSMKAVPRGQFTLPASMSMNAVAVLTVPMSFPMQSSATRLTSCNDVQMV
jgi:hypothetical protein